MASKIQIPPQVGVGLGSAVQRWAALESRIKAEC
jgi:hypothetical protein